MDDRQISPRLLREISSLRVRHNEQSLVFSWVRPTRTNTRTNGGKNTVRTTVRTPYERRANDGANYGANYGANHGANYGANYERELSRELRDAPLCPPYISMSTPRKYPPTGSLPLSPAFPLSLSTQLIIVHTTSACR